MGIKTAFLTRKSGTTFLAFINEQFTNISKGYYLKTQGLCPNCMISYIKMCIKNYIFIYGILQFGPKTGLAPVYECVCYMYAVI